MNCYTRAVARERLVPAKGRELIDRALRWGRACPNGPGEAASVRALVARGLLAPGARITEQGELFADTYLPRRTA